MAGFVGYGTGGGIRAVEQLRRIMGELKIADVPAQSHCRCSPTSPSRNRPTRPTRRLHLRPAPRRPLTRMLEEIVTWFAAPAPLRAERQSATA
ncbi:hypothetical protein [Actinomadura sp. WAC 06369]|uniref:hypothetical protein n=1 Tax=Actinomadura sp. WAC 06369 TaxID=2203193 RepID=UPI0018F52233|nr:hypothetical protein [Actinomadura sp. WAC 06369]